MDRNTGAALPRSLNDEAAEVRATAEHLAGKLRVISSNLHDRLVGPRKEDGAPEAPPYRSDCLEGQVHGTNEALAKIAQTIEDLARLDDRIGDITAIVDKGAFERSLMERMEPPRRSYEATRDETSPARQAGVRYG